MSWGSLTSVSPIWVSGVYRSGTTFLAAMLGSHPQLRSASSTVKFLRFCLDRYGDVALDENARRLVSETLSRVSTRWQLSFDSDEVIALARSHGDPVSYASLYQALMQVMLGGGNSELRWVEKLAMQWRDIPKFLHMFPNGKVVHIIRDPRDVTASYKAMTFEPGYTFLDAAFNCRGAMQEVESFAKRYRAQVKVVRAEDFARYPQEQIRSLCQFLQLQFDPAMLEPENFRAEGEDWATNTSFDGRIAGFPKAEARWPLHLSHAERLFVELVCQPYMSTYGYEVCDPTSGTIDWPEIGRFLQDEFIAQRFSQWLKTGKGAQGYRTDPYDYEMKIVFPERYATNGDDS